MKIKYFFPVEHVLECVLHPVCPQRLSACGRVSCVYRMLVFRFSTDFVWRCTADSLCAVAFRLKPAGGGLRPKPLRLDGWLAFMNDAHLIDTQFPLSDASLCYLWSRMFVVDEIKDYNR